MAWIAAPVIDWVTPANKPQAAAELISTAPDAVPSGTAMIAAPKFDTIITVPAVGYATS